MTKLWTGRPGVRIPARARAFYPLQNSQTGSGASGASYAVGRRVLFPAMKRPGREAGNSLLFSIEVKNELGCTFIPTICLRDLCRDFAYHHFCSPSHAIHL